MADPSSLDPVVELVVGPRLRPLEGVTVNRVWPTARRRLIGPFIFLDHLQPVALPAGQGLDVPAHPHIGLATVTYLFAGELMHRDSLGIVQPIRPGDLNWMTAGRGIAHSERSTDEERARPSRIHGVQAWVALPRASELAAPRFEHVSKADLPQFVMGDAWLTLIAGTAYGRTAPVSTDSPLFYVEARLESGGALEVPAQLGERGVFVVEGAIAIEGKTYEGGRLLVLRDTQPCLVEAKESTRLMLLGGEPLDGERLIWWNFVASDAALIEAAKLDWAQGHFPAVPGETGRMSLPAG
jgi:redox-sensitive bicupin YhaK (pirin superfamily)